MNLSRRVLTRLLLTLALVVVILPFVPLWLTSFSVGWQWPRVFPESFSGRAWHYVMLGSAGTWQAVWTSVFIAGVVTSVNILLAIPAAHALVRFRFRGKWLMEAILFAPIVIPPFVAVMGIHLTFLRLGLTETVLGVVLAHVSPTLPYMVRAMMISYQTLSTDWEDQARMLGAGPFARFSSVVFPHIFPGVIAGASLSVLISLSQYLITFIIGSGQVVTLPILLFPFISGGDPSVAAAFSIVFAAMSILSLLALDGLLKTYYRRKKIRQKKQKE